MKKCPNRTAVFFLARGGLGDATVPGLFAGRRIPVNRAARREVLALERHYIPPEDKVRRKERLKARHKWRAMRQSRLQGLMGMGRA